LRAWLRARLVESSDRLFSWTLAMLSADDLEAAVRTPAQRDVRDVLDGFVALEIDVEPLVPAAVLEWFRRPRPAA
jgi:hypothetical protein